MFDRQAMVRMGSIRVFRCDTKERATGDVGPVRQSLEFGQSLTQILWGGGVKEIVPKSSIAVFEVCEHEGIFAFEMPIEGRLCDLGDGHDLLGASRADPLCIEEAVGNFQNSLLRIGVFLCSHRVILTEDRPVCLMVNMETDVSVYNLHTKGNLR